METRDTIDKQRESQSRSLCVNMYIDRVGHHHILPELLGEQRRPQRPIQFYPTYTLILILLIHSLHYMI